MACDIMIPAGIISDVCWAVSENTDDLTVVKMVNFGIFFTDLASQVL